MALFILTVLIILNSFKYLLSSQVVENDGKELEIKPSAFTGGRYFGVYQVEDTLNLSCIISNELNSESMLIDWIFPIGAKNRLRQVVNHVNSNLANLVIKNLTENDSGEYKCTALNEKDLWYSEKSIVINVKNKKGECSDMMFQCSCGMCIHKRYTCDGFKDCHHGEDELSNYCGPGNPCDNKLRCPDGRCIPYTWCCDLVREQNCTTKLKHDCCIHMEKLTHDIDSDMGYQYKEHEYYGWGLLQTTIYTTIGCALAFNLMILVIVIVMVTCRMYKRRSLISRCPATNTRNVNIARNTAENHLNHRQFYGLDVHFNRPSCNSNDLMSVNPLLVTYNINNGIQFIGRPVEPPPYCEIVKSPPKEGPPPPYESQENLSLQQQEESTEPKEGSGDSESDTLLGTSNQVSAISSNAIDGDRSGERSSLVPSEEEETRFDVKIVFSSNRNSKSTPNVSSVDDNFNSNQCLDRSAIMNISDSPKTEALGSIVLISDNLQTEGSGARKTT